MRQSSRAFPRSYSTPFNTRLRVYSDIIVRLNDLLTVSWKTFTRDQGWFKIRVPILPNTISNFKYQTTHLDTVRLLDSKHFAVLLRCCDSHHIRRVVLRNENSSSPKICKAPAAFHCRLIERSRWITGITMIYFSCRQSRTTEEIFFSMRSLFFSKKSWITRLTGYRLRTATSLDAKDFSLTFLSFSFFFFVSCNFFSLLASVRFDSSDLTQRQRRQQQRRRRCDVKTTGFSRLSPLSMKRTSECAYGADCCRI